MRSFPSLFWLCSAALGCAASGAIEAETQPAVPVELGQVETAVLRETSDYLATLRSRRSLTLRPQVEGQVARIFVRSGDQVHKGQLLMQIDPARQFHTVESQRASASARRAAQAYAVQEYARLQTLFATGAASRQELEQARSAAEAAEADVAALSAQVRESEVRLRFFGVEAPEGGVVGDLSAREGDYVTPQSVLTTLDQSGALELYVSVPVERAGALRLAMPLELTDDAGQVVGQSRVTFISPEVAEETQSVLVKAEIANQSGRLRPSQFVRARVIWSERRGPALPVSAIKRFNGQTFVFAAIAKQGKLTAEQRPVSLGPVDGQIYPVLKGIGAGEAIVLSGLQKLHDGSPIAQVGAQVGTAAPVGGKG